MNENSEKLLKTAREEAESATGFLACKPHIVPLWMSAMLSSSKRGPVISKWTERGILTMLKHMKEDGQVPLYFKPKLVLGSEPVFHEELTPETWLLAALANYDHRRFKDEAQRLVGYLYSRKMIPQGEEVRNVQGTELAHQRNFLVSGGNLLSYTSPESVWLVPQLVLLNGLRQLSDPDHRGNIENLKSAIQSAFGNHMADVMGGNLITPGPLAWYEEMFGPTAVAKAPAPKDAVEFMLMRIGRKSSEAHIESLARDVAVNGIRPADRITGADDRLARLITALAIIHLL